MWPDLMSRWVSYMIYGKDQSNYLFWAILSTEKLVYTDLLELDLYYVSYPFKVRYFLAMNFKFEKKENSTNILFFLHVSFFSYFDWNLIFFVALQHYIAWIGRRAATYRLRTAKRTDKRVRIMNEIIQAIQVIKMYTWEKSFARVVDKIRK